MNEKQLFGLALGLTSHWFIDKAEFDLGKCRLDLFLDFERGAKFLCPECQREDPCPVHDTNERT
jgi:transposase